MKNFDQFQSFRKIFALLQEKNTSVEQIKTVIVQTENDDNSLENIDNYDLSNLRIKNQSKAWYFINGTRCPKPASINETGVHSARLLPLKHIQNDRILNQLMFVPPNYNATHQLEQPKTIFVSNMPAWWDIKEDDSIFADCPVKNCKITIHKEESKDADLVFFHEMYSPLPHKRQPSQLFALYHLESPFHTASVIHQGYFDIFIDSFAK